MFFFVLSSNFCLALPNYYVNGEISRNVIYKFSYIEKNCQHPSKFFGKYQILDKVVLKHLNTYAHSKMRETKTKTYIYIYTHMNTVKSRKCVMYFRVVNDKVYDNIQSSRGYFSMYLISRLIRVLCKRIAIICFTQTCKIISNDLKQYVSFFY